MKTLLLCVDGSAASTAATRVALGLARRLAGQGPCALRRRRLGSRVARRRSDRRPRLGGTARRYAREALLQRVRTLAADGGVELECVGRPGRAVRAHPGPRPDAAARLHRHGSHRSARSGARARRQRGRARARVHRLAARHRPRVAGLGAVRAGSSTAGTTPSCCTFGRRPIPRSVTSRVPSTLIHAGRTDVW